jgi:hypothetical protein
MRALFVDLHFSRASTATLFISFAFIHIMDFALNQPLEGAAAGPMQHRFEPYDDNGGYVE